MATRNQELSAHNWRRAEHLASRHRYGTKVRVPMHSVRHLPPEFERSARSINNGAKAVYRDQQARDSFQIREFDDYWTIEMDQYNPEHYPIQHAVADAPKYTFGAAFAVWFLFGGGGS